MKNLLSRDEYLYNVKEGFIKDTIRKGAEKIKSMFKIGMKKIKGIISIFDGNGKPLPVVSPQSVADKFSNGDTIKAFASNALNESIKEAGGNTCDTSAKVEDTGENYDWGPSGNEFVDWLKDKKYKDTLEYKNFMSISSILEDNYNNMDGESFVNESWEDVKKERVSYRSDEEIDELTSVGTEKFKKKLMRYFTNPEDMRNMLVFGAPGIGKSTIPKAIVDTYNTMIAKTDSERIALITVDCPNLNIGDLMMPTIPREKNIREEISNAKDAFPQASDYLDNLSPEESKAIDSILSTYKQYESGDAPKYWLPSYRKTGTKFDKVLDEYANGGIYTDANGESHKTGGGGIIMLDEFLRCPQEIFSEFLILLTARELKGYTLGSKWRIIACTNRPCDDDEVNRKWAVWSGTPAAKDRFPIKYNFDPSPDEWKEWARTKGMDKRLLDFIFDEVDAHGEYPRWHSVVKGGGGTQVNAVTPRGWMQALIGINGIKKENGYTNITEFSIADLQDAFEDVFDKSFVTEITDWFEKHMDSVSLDEIIEDPNSVKLPKKFASDPARYMSVVENIYDQFKEKYKDDPDTCTDDILFNITVWFGQNYRNDVMPVFNDFYGKLDGNVFPKMDAYRSLSGRVKSSMLLRAAWPQSDLQDDCKYFENVPDKKEGSRWPKNSIETIKEYMKKYFPWRIKGDNINYYDALKDTE